MIKHFYRNGKIKPFFNFSIFEPLSGTVLIYLSRYLDQETAKRPFWSSSQAATCYYQSNDSKVEAIPFSALPKGTTSELAGLFPQYPFQMLNVKQGSCEYQLLKSFGLTRPGNRTLYRL